MKKRASLPWGWRAKLLLLVLFCLVGLGDQSEAQRPQPSGGTVATLAGVQTLTNKRITPRVTTVASGVTLACNVDTADVCSQQNTQGAGTLTLSAPGGTPTAMQPVRYRIKCTNAQTYAFNAAFRFSTSVTAPVTCAAGKTDYLGAFYNDTDSVWDVVSTDLGH